MTSGRARSTTVDAVERGSEDLAALTAELERIASELASQPEEERAVELVRQASELSARAGRAVESALRADASAPDA